MTESAFNGLISQYKHIAPPRRIEGKPEIIGYFKHSDERHLEPVISEIYISDNSIQDIVKAEDILNYLVSVHSTYIVKLNNQEYFTQGGSLFKDVLNSKKRKLVILYQQLNPLDAEKFILFDKDIITNPEDPMNRFILRKFITHIAARNMLFGFADLSANLLQPSPPLEPNAFNDIRGDIAQMCNEYYCI